MTEVASRELRNHTADVLRRVEAGEEITITVRGKPVAQVVPIRSRQRRRPMPWEELVALLERIPHDPTFKDDLAWTSGDTTDDLGPIQ